MKLNYKKEYQKKLKENINEVLNLLNSPEMQFKIKNWADKFNYSFDEILQKIKDDPIFRCVFAKDPAKQNLYQTLAAEFIKRMEIVNDFEILPSGGNNALYLTNGKLFCGKDLKNSAKDIKSIDFTWKCGDMLFYASHKYTELSGGAQDNQYLDIQSFLKNARDNNEKKIIFLAICDGDYYKLPDSSTKDKTKIERLKKLTCKNSFVVNIDELENLLRRFKKEGA